MNLTDKDLIKFGLKCAKWSDFATKDECNEIPMANARLNVIKRLIKQLNEPTTKPDTSKANLTIPVVSNSVCKHVWKLNPDADGKFRCIDCGYVSPIKTDY